MEKISIHTWVKKLWAYSCLDHYERAELWHCLKDYESATTITRIIKFYDSAMALHR